MLVANAIAPASVPGVGYDATVLADSPTFFWPFSESSGTTATDEADSNTGTYTGGCTLGAVGIGDGETAVLLDGSTGYIAPASGLGAGFATSGLMAVEMWIFPTSFPAGSTCLMDSPNFTEPFSWYLGASGFVHFNVGNISNQQGSTSTSAVTVNVWNYLAATCTGTMAGSAWTGTIAQYLNGSANGTTSVVSQNLSGVQGGWKFGAPSAANTTTFFVGRMAKATYYDSAVITSTQITAHYAAATGGSASPLTRTASVLCAVSSRASCW